MLDFKKFTGPARTTSDPAKDTIRIIMIHQGPDHLTKGDKSLVLSGGNATPFSEKQKNPR
jgi:hypothetical protein